MSETASANEASAREFPIGRTIEYVGPKGGVEMVDKVVLKESAFAETDDFGPVFDESGAFDWKALRRWVVRLSGLPSDAVRQFPNRVMHRIATMLSDEVLPPESQAQKDGAPVKPAKPVNPFPLGKALAVGKDKTITEVQLREPTFAETEDFGQVIDRFNNIDWKALKRWVMRLSGLPEDAVRQLPNPVMYRMAAWIAREVLPPEVTEKNLD